VANTKKAGPKGKQQNPDRDRNSGRETKRERERVCLVMVEKTQIQQINNVAAF